MPWSLLLGSRFVAGFSNSFKNVVLDRLEILAGEELWRAGRAHQNRLRRFYAGFEVSWRE
jgi:hypothetical protein